MCSNSDFFVLVTSLVLNAPSGVSGSGGKHRRTLDSTEFYDEASGSWKLGPPLPAPMRAMVAIPKSDTEVFLFASIIIRTALETESNEKFNKKLVLFDVSTGN